MTNILIVGAGPCSLIAAKTCIELGYKVSILNPRINEWQNVQTLNLINKIILKSRNQKQLFISPKWNDNFRANKIEVYENFVFGGLSELWGGVFLPPTNGKHINQSFKDQEVFEAIQSIENSIEIENKSSSLYTAYRSSSEINYHLSVKPTLARSYNNRENKWSAAESFSELEKEGVNFIDGYLDKINVMTDESIEVSYLNDNNQETIKIFKHVFLGTGTFGTARIILNNRKDVNSIEIKDSKVTYGLSLSKPKLSSQIKILEMKPEIIQMNPDEKGGIESFVQIYKISEELIKSIKFERLQWLISLVNILSLGSLRLVMTFHPSTESKSILVSKADDVLIASQKSAENQIKFKTRKYLRIMRQNHLIPITPEFKFNPGSGVHCGAFLINYKNGISKNVEHGLDSWPRVHILGSASMKKIPTGPIMFEAMVNSRIIVKRALA
jgi:hypothetical protein